MGIPICADMGDEAQVSAVFRRIAKEHGRLHVLANAGWGPQLIPEWSKPFWKLSERLWPETLSTIGTCWLTSVHAARMMTEARRGLIVHITDNYEVPGDDVTSGRPSSDPSAWRGQALHDLGHESINRLIFAMSKQTHKFNVTVVGLNPALCAPNAC